MEHRRPLHLSDEPAAHYLVYFLAGAGVGIYGIDRGLLACDGSLARGWRAWIVAALAAFALAGGLMLAGSEGASYGWRIAGSATFVLSCAASSCALLAVFLRFARTRSSAFESLGENAYGMFIVHFPFAIWLQYGLLALPLPGLFKGSAVFLGTVGLSWAATAMLRRIPAIARVI